MKNETIRNETVIMDELMISDLTQSFFNVFTNTEGRLPDWDIIDRICIPQTIIIKKTELSEEVYSLESFIEPRKLLLSNGSLIEFEEREMTHETKIIGNIAQRVSFYTKSGSLNGSKFTKTGTKFFQFIKTNNQWKINSVIWEDD